MEWIISIVILGLLVWVMFVLNKKNQLETEKRLETLMSNILEKKEASLDKKSQEIISPLKEEIKDLRKTNEQINVNQTKLNAELRKEIESIVKHGADLGEQTKNLTSALKGDAKIRGDWGEHQLESILERSGLEKNVNYYVQKQEKEKRIDVFIKMPDERYLVIDSKVSFVNYLNYCNETTDEQKDEFAKKHILDIEKNIKDLSEKKYYERFENKQQISPDFTLMFIHPEPAMILALKENPSLTEKAWDKRIALVSSTPLIHTLKIIEKLWKMDTQNKRIKEALKKAEGIHKKLSTFVSTFDEVGSKMGKAVESYNEAQGQLKSGAGNLIKRVDDFIEYGVDAKKISTEEIEVPKIEK